jgi:uncharacterized protein (TIGR02117 family)
MPPPAAPGPPAPRRARWRRAGRTALRAGLLAAGATVLSTAAAVLLCLVPVNTGYVPAASGIEMFVSHFGVHVDFVLPVRSEARDWSRLVPPALFPYVPPEADFIAFGWGDRGFYVETPTWSDLRCGTAVAALTYQGGSAMCVEYLPRPAPGPNKRRLLLTEAQYAALCAHVEAGFARDAAGRVRPILRRYAFGNHAFFEGTGRYGLFYSCNTWVNEGLRKIGVRTGAWALFAFGVMRHLPE